MKNIPIKNYFYLLIILVITVVLTINILNMYKLSKRVETEFYKYANTISSKEFDSYITEYPDSIIYIYDKYNTDYKDFETEFKENIEQSYYKNNLVYMDKKNINKKFKNKLKENYNIELEYNNMPIILIVEDGVITKKVEVELDNKLSDLDLGVFE